MTQNDIDQMERNKMLDKLIAEEKAKPSGVEATKAWENKNLMEKSEPEVPAEPVAPVEPPVETGVPPNGEPATDLTPAVETPAEVPAE